jgi:glucokinase
MGVTLGTGLGFGLVINGQLFTGGNGLAMEYGLSPFEWGICEKNVSIGYIRKRAKEVYGEDISPRIIEKYFKENDKKAIQIYNEYGNNLGIILSHVINMIDPQVIAIGGGLSKAFECFKGAMFEALERHSPSFNLNNIIIAQSKLREQSTMLGASMMVKNKLK